MLSFSGMPARGPFWKLIITGAKCQTVRVPRKQPIEAGDILYLYWKVRTPREKKYIHHIGIARCTAVEYRHYKEFSRDDTFAYADGFLNADELRDWFGDVSPDTIFCVIHWQPLGGA